MSQYNIFSMHLSLSRWQFGSDDWLEGLRVGEASSLMLMSGKQHVAQWHQKWVVSLHQINPTKITRTPGHFAKSKLVEMHLKGDIFAPMVISAPSD